MKSLNRFRSCPLKIIFIFSLLALAARDLPAATSAAELRPVVSRFAEGFRTGRPQTQDQLLLNSWYQSQRGLALDIAAEWALLSPAEFNALTELALRHYIREANDRAAYRLLLDSVAQAIAPELEERRLRTLPSETIDGALAGSGIYMLGRVGLALSRVGIFRLFLVRARSQVLSRVAPGRVTGLSARGGAGNVERGLPESLRRYWPAGHWRQLGVFAAGGSIYGAIGHGLERLHEHRLDPREALEALDLWLVFERYAVAACELRQEAEAIHRELLRANPPAIGAGAASNSAPRIIIPEADLAKLRAIRARADALIPELRSFQQLNSEFQEPQPLPEAIPQFGRLNLASQFPRGQLERRPVAESEAQAINCRQADHVSYQPIEQDLLQVMALTPAPAPERSSQ